MLYNGVKIYPSRENLFQSDNKTDNAHTVTALIIHTGEDKFLFREISIIKENHLADSIFVIIPSNRQFNEECTKDYGFVNWAVFQKEYDRVDMVVMIAKETTQEFIMLLDSSYNITVFDKNAVLGIFESDEHTACVSPYVYSNVNVVFPTCYAPKINDGVRADIISVIPEYPIQNTLYPFMLLGIYKRNVFLLDVNVDSKIKDVDCRAYDFFARLWLMGYRTYLSSFFAIQCNREFIPIIDRSISPSVRRLSAKLLSFYKNRGGKAGLRPFWWVNYSIICVVKDVRPFLKNALMDFWTLVKMWTIEPGELNDIS